LADQYPRRPPHSRQRPGVARIVGQRSFHPSRRPRLRRHLSESASPVITTMPKSPSHTSFFRILCLINVLCFLYLPSSFAEHTRRWRQSAYDEFLKGTAHGVAVRSDGRLELAPKFSLLADADASYLWSIRIDPKGTLYAAGGSPAKVFRFDSPGKPTVVFDSTDLSAQAMAFDSRGVLFLAFDSNGNLVAGTEPSGRILRMSRSSSKTSARDSKDSAAAKAEGFVLYETSRREITSLIAAPDGTIYVSAIGEKQRTGQAPTTVISTPQGTTTFTTGPVVNPGQAQPQQPFVPFPPIVSTSIYRISNEGAPEELWTSREDVVYSLGLASDGRLLAGTGNDGALLAIDGHGVFAHLAKSGSAQITGIARNSSGKVFLCTANPGK